MPGLERLRPRRWLGIVFVLSLFGLMCMGLVLGLVTLQRNGRTQRRAAWLDQFELEIQRQMESDLVADKGKDATPWLSPFRAVFGTGSARWRVHTFHDDREEGGWWSGVGDVAVMIDDRGQRHYSRSHFCDGTIAWALGSPLADPGPRSADIDAFLGLFRPGTWTTDRPTVEAALPPRNPVNSPR